MKVGLKVCRKKNKRYSQLVENDRKKCIVDTTTLLPPVIIIIILLEITSSPPLSPFALPDQFLHVLIEWDLNGKKQKMTMFQKTFFHSLIHSPFHTLSLSSDSPHPWKAATTGPPSESAQKNELNFSSFFITFSFLVRTSIAQSPPPSTQSVSQLNSLTMIRPQVNSLSFFSFKILYPFFNPLRFKVGSRSLFCSVTNRNSFLHLLSASFSFFFLQHYPLDLIPFNHDNNLTNHCCSF